jgi:uncharacterized membrane protein (UPF0136 family)
MYDAQETWMLSLALLYLLVFGVLTIGGGVMGFVKAKSRASLIAGTISGGLLIFAGVVYFAASPSRLHVQIHLVIGLVVSLALSGRFVGAYRKSGKVMPAGLMALLGIVGVILTAVALAAGT